MKSRMNSIIRQFHADQAIMPMLMPASSGVCINRIGLRAGWQTRCASCECVHANAETTPRLAARDATREKRMMMATRWLPSQQHAEVQDDDRGDENSERQQEFALGDQVGLAGFVESALKISRIERCTGMFFQPGEDHQPEKQAEDANHNS